jgi:hypothetical protein
MSMLEVDKTTFEAEVLQAPCKVVVDFLWRRLRALCRADAPCA